MRRAALLLALFAAAPAARAQAEAAECPPGTHRIATQDPYRPFRCVKDEPKRGFGSVTGPQGFKFRPKCPHGTRPVATGNGLQPYKCVRASAGESDPELVPLRAEGVEAPEDEAAPEDPMTRGCPPGKRKVRTNDPLRPFQCVVQASRAAKLSDSDYRRYTVPAELSFDYPKAFAPRDSWKDEVPTITFTLDDGSPGKPVTLSIARIEPGQPTYADLDAAIAKDRDWLNAQDGGTVMAAGVKARLTFVAGETRSAYVPLAGGAYYAVTYSAPVESYESYLAAFNRLLKTLRVVRKGR